MTGVAPEADDLTWCIGPPLLGSFEQLLGDKNQATDALKKYRERFSEIGIFENDLYPEIADTLRTLIDRKYRLFVATSKPTVYAKRIVDHFELAGYFDDVYGSDLDGTRSDKSELLSFLMKTADVKPEHAAMVGDRRYDITGARNNHMRPIGVLYGYGSKTELIEAGAEAVCDRPTGLLSLF